MLNVHNLAQAANWRSLVKKRLWSCNRVPSFKLIEDQNPLGLLPLVKSNNLKEGTRLQLQRHFYQTATNFNLRQIVHIYPNWRRVDVRCLSMFCAAREGPSGPRMWNNQGHRLPGARAVSLAVHRPKVPSDTTNTLMLMQVTLSPTPSCLCR
jgi:hypothetical protein